MSLMQDRLIQALPTSKTLKEAKLKAGYSQESRQVYRKHTKAHIAKALAEIGINKESLTKAYTGLLDLCTQKGDLATAKGTIDSLGKLHNYMKDNQTVQTTVINTDMLRKFRERGINAAESATRSVDVTPCPTTTTSAT